MKYMFKLGTVLVLIGYSWVEIAPQIVAQSYDKIGMAMALGLYPVVGGAILILLYSNWSEEQGEEGKLWAIYVYCICIFPFILACQHTGWLTISSAPVILTLSILLLRKRRSDKKIDD